MTQEGNDEQETRIRATAQRSDQRTIKTGGNKEAGGGLNLSTASVPKMDSLSMAWS